MNREVPLPTNDNLPHMQTSCREEWDRPVSMYACTSDRVNFPKVTSVVVDELTMELSAYVGNMP